MSGQSFLYIVLQGCVRVLPLRFAYGLGCWLADVQWRISTQDRKAVIANLTQVLGRPPLPRESKDVFRNFAKYLVDFLTMSQRVNTAFISKNVVIEGIGYLQQVIALGKGGIIVSSHLGNWEMGGAVLSALGYPVSVLALAHQDEQVNKFFNRQREQAGYVVIQTNVAVRRVIEHLRMNKLVAILAERDFGQNGIKLPFLGKEALIPKGAAVFSLKTGAPLLPTFFLRQPHDTFKIVFCPPLFPPTTTHGNIDEDVLKGYMRQYLAVIERFTRLYPTQWLLFRDFTAS